MAIKLFGTKEGKGGKTATAERIPRHSSGWVQFSKDLTGREELRVLDFGPTSPGNINFITGMGHSIYMADLVEAARDPIWTRQTELFEDAEFDTKRFMEENLAFGDRKFDVVLLWDTLDYLKPRLAEAVVHHIHAVMADGARLLAFFHMKPDNAFFRYHLRQDEQVDMQQIGEMECSPAYTTRQIETLFNGFSGYKFFLAKDNLREVIVNR